MDSAMRASGSTEKHDTVICISSDEETIDTSSSKKPAGIADNRLLEWNKKTQIVNKQIRAASSLNKRKDSEIAQLGEGVKGELDNFQTKYQSDLECPECSKVMFQPYSIYPCGHSMCSICLVKFFEKQVEMYSEDGDNQDYEVHLRGLVDRLVLDLQGPQKVLYQQQLTTVLNPARFAFNLHCCPVCFEGFPAPPTFNYLLRELVDSIFDDAPPAIPERDIFDRFFPPQFDYDQD